MPEIVVAGCRHYARPLERRGLSCDIVSVYNVCTGMSEDNPYMVCLCSDLSNLHTGTRSDGEGPYKRAKTEGRGAGERAAIVSTVNVPGLGSPTGFFVRADGTIMACAGQCIRTFKPGSDLQAQVLAGFDQGNGFRDGPGDEARFKDLQGITEDPYGNVLVLDSGNNALRRVSKDGEVRTLAGGGMKDFIDGKVASVRFRNLNAVVMTPGGDYVMTDFSNHAVRVFTSGGAVCTLAGNGYRGFVDGSGLAAQFDGPSGLALDLDGSILVADWGNNAIRRVAMDGTVSTVAGNGEPGYADGEGGSARFRGPCAVVVDMEGTIVVADSGNNRLRRITGRHVTTMAGGSAAGAETGTADGNGQDARFDRPYLLALDERGRLLVAEVAGVDKLRVVDASLAPPAWMGPIKTADRRT
jgi:hypothetical protein